MSTKLIKRNRTGTEDVYHTDPDCSAIKSLGREHFVELDEAPITPADVRICSHCSGEAHENHTQDGVNCPVCGFEVRNLGSHLQGCNEELAAASKRDFYELYWGEGMSTAEVADEYDTGRGLLTRHLKEHGIPIRTDYNDPTKYAVRQLSTETLERLYEDRSIREVSEYLGVGRGTVRHALRRRGILGE